ncbi:MAG: 4Fe-4S binding protein [Coriobacteriales bacterium]|jgi:ferredoxin-type protein NapH|nr:4Fe-4S binding protein [Coriobacteriales bacterium]
MKLSLLRRITLVAVVLLAVAGLIWHLGIGSLSSFGWQYIASICPLGAVEIFLASQTIFPRALIALLLVIVLGVLFGKAFCSWLCPIPPLRRFFIRGKKKSTNPVLLESTAECTPSEGCTDGCDSCAEKRKKLDSRHLVLGGALLSTVIFGFPVFCLVCPVGLVFATIIAFWHWIGFNDLTISLVAFPAILLVEVLVLRKWCLRFCPLGAVMSLISLPNRFFRPQVNTSKCLRSQGTACTVCVDSCEELLDPHYKEGMHECSKCGLCRENCPTQAITIPFLPAKKQRDVAAATNPKLTP